MKASSAMILFSFSPAAWDRLSLVEQKELVSEFAAALRLSTNRALVWMTDLEHISSRLATGTATPSDVPLFWIRLHGLLTDAQSSYSKTSFEPTNEVQQRLVAAAKESQSRYLAIRTTLKEDEIIYVDYQRNIEAHCYVNSYFLRGKEKAGALTLLRSRFVPALDRNCQLTEIRDAVSRISTFGQPEMVAAAIGSRITGPVTRFAEWLRSTIDIWQS